MMRIAALLPALVLVLALAGAAAASERDVVVAFRADAPPFSVAEDGSYHGFIAALCEEAVDRSGYRIARRVPFSAADRGALARSGEIDLVCDPTTVTVERARRLDFSPIVFIANSGFLRSPEPRHLSESEIARSEDCRRLHAAGPDRKLVGAAMVAGTTARATYDLARESGHAQDTMEYAVCPIEFDSHAEGVAEFCDGSATFYFGDLDIVMEAARRHGTCPSRDAGEFRAYEPYAIAIPTQNGGFRRAFVSALYALFSEGTATSVYNEAFGTAKMSDPLQMLFRVNSVPRGEVPTD